MDYLIQGKDYLAKYPDFDLVGRDEELESLCSILVRKQANSVFIVGPSGVGCSSIILGLQKLKEDPSTSFDIASKRLFWLDNDFMSFNGDEKEIQENFQKTMKVLKRTPNSVLIITKAKSFIESSKSHGCAHFLTALNAMIKMNHTQVILEVSDVDMDYVWKSNSDMMDHYTMMDVTEPKQEHLLKIVKEGIEPLYRNYKIAVDEDAVTKAIELTSKYRSTDQSLSMAQPAKTITLIDRAYSFYALNAHRQHPDVSALEKTLKTSENPEMVQEHINALNANFAQTQVQISKLLSDQRELEIKIIDLEETLEAQIEEEKNAKKNSEQNGEAEVKRLTSFTELTSRGGFESDKVRAIKDQIKKWQTVIDQSRKQYEDLTAEINSKLKLTSEEITKTFSRISKIPTDKLDENDREKLRGLEAGLNKRIFGQAHAVTKLSNAVKIARVGKRKKSKPQASFMFLGPSGVGKTEIAKALSEWLMGDEKLLTRFDMSEYMEKHAVARMIGAPPGYEGFEAGGILTNLMRSNQNRILLFDEIEKAHPDVFNIFLQILSDGRLTDNVGRTVSFEDSIIIMTTNIGQANLLDESMEASERLAAAMKELEGIYKPEFLNRFAGRENIICFNKLELDSVQKIVRREMVNLDETYTENGIRINISEDELYKFCKARYNPVIGARGLPGYIETHVEPIIVNKILDNPDVTGSIELMYDEASDEFNYKMVA